MKKKALLRTAWALALALLLLLLLRTFVGDVYLVSSGSMEPTIHGLEGGGEWVFVRFDRAPPQRNEIVVILPAAEGEPFVKRVVGLPYESLQIVRGDVWIDSRILRRAEEPVLERPLVTVFDDRWMPLEGSFRMGSTVRNPWSQVDGAWRVDAGSVAAGKDEGVMYFAPKLVDDYLTPDHVLAPGETDVNDAVIECEVYCEAPRGRIRMQLVELGDIFELTLAPAGGSAAVGLLTRRSLAADGEFRLERLPHCLLPSFATKTWHRVRFSNIDNVLALEVDGKPTNLRHEYDGNEFHPADRTREGLSQGPRVFLGAEGGAFRFRGMRILRDLFYTQRGAHGGRTPTALGPDEYFVLGDNSAHSLDSREWGPIHRERIIGRAVAVVWPPARWRSLATPAMQ